MLWIVTVHFSPLCHSRFIVPVYPFNVEYLDCFQFVVSMNKIAIKALCLSFSERVLLLLWVYSFQITLLLLLFTGYFLQSRVILTFKSIR